MSKPAQSELTEELAERVDEWHLSPSQHLILRLNARLRGVDVGDPMAAWRQYRQFHARCAVCARS